MIKWIFIFLLSFFSISSFAANDYLSCNQALPDDHVNFCSSFKSVASCHCKESGLPANQCKNMNTLYQLMLATYGSLENACSHQHDTSKQVCIDDWNCYRLGGKDSHGKLCSSTGNACK